MAPPGVPGPPYGEAAWLAAWAVAEWGLLDGRATAAGFDLLDLAPARILNFAWAVLTDGMDLQQRGKVVELVEREARMIDLPRHLPVVAFSVIPDERDVERDAAVVPPRLRLDQAPSWWRGADAAAASFEQAQRGG